MSNYNFDLNYAIPNIDISEPELKAIIAEANIIIFNDNLSSEELADTNIPILNGNLSSDELALAYLKKAQCMQKLGQYAGKSEGTQRIIKNLLERALELSPDMPEALMQMGKWNHIQCNYCEALNMYNRAIQLKPDYAAAFNNRGVTYVETGNYRDNMEKAIADYTEAIRLRPSEGTYYFNRGLNYSKLGLHKEAIADLSESIRLKPGLTNALFLRALTYISAGDKDKAKADFDDVLRRRKLKNNFHSIII